MTSPISPTVTGEKQMAPLQTQGLLAEKEAAGSAHPTSATPASAGATEGVNVKDAAPVSGVERKPGEY